MHHPVDAAVVVQSGLLVLGCDIYGVDRVVGDVSRCVDVVIQGWGTCCCSLERDMKSVLRSGRNGMAVGDIGEEETVVVRDSGDYVDLMLFDLVRVVEQGSLVEVSDQGAVWSAGTVPAHPRFPLDHSWQMDVSFI